MKSRTLIMRYAAFASLATLLNLSCQRFILKFESDFNFYVIAILIGTLSGLMLKYVLDKKWIFFDKTSGFQVHREIFLRYLGTGTLTTAIFWAFETIFWFFWRTDLMREAGAVIGLSLGYILKFFLDRQYTFLRNDRDT